MFSCAHPAFWAPAVAGGAALCLGLAAAAGQPTAIVEDIDAPGAEIRIMDYVEAGRVIGLGREGTVTLGYLRSCLRETVTGGRVTVGRERSRVDGGTVRRERVECDGGALKLSAEKAGKSAVLVLRRPPGTAAGGGVRPSLTIYGASPVIKLGGDAGRVVIERLDRPGRRIDVTVSGGFADLATSGQSLQPGGIYRARAGERTIVFKVDAYAARGRSPVVGRLIQF